MTCGGGVMRIGFGAGGGEGRGLLVTIGEIVVVVVVVTVVDGVSLGCGLHLAHCVDNGNLVHIY